MFVTDSTKTLRTLQTNNIAQLLAYIGLSILHLTSTVKEIACIFIQQMAPL